MERIEIITNQCAVRGQGFRVLQGTATEQRNSQSEWRSREVTATGTANGHTGQPGLSGLMKNDTMDTQASTRRRLVPLSRVFASQASHPRFNPRPVRSKYKGKNPTHHWWESINSKRVPMAWHTGQHHTSGAGPVVRPLRPSELRIWNS